MGLAANEILDVIKRSDRCYQTVRGFVAEYQLEKRIQRLVESGLIRSYLRINRDGKPDFSVELTGRSEFIECKNVKTSDVFKNGDRKVDFQRTRNQVGQAARTGRYYKPGEFDILAAAEHSSDGVWSFKFIRTKDLPTKVEEGVTVFQKVVRVPRVVHGTMWSTDLGFVLGLVEPHRASESTGLTGPVAEPRIVPLQ